MGGDFWSLDWLRESFFCRRASVCLLKQMQSVPSEIFFAPSCYMDCQSQRYSSILKCLIVKQAKSGKQQSHSSFRRQSWTGLKAQVTTCRKLQLQVAFARRKTIRKISTLINFLGKNEALHQTDVTQPLPTIRVFYCHCRGNDQSTLSESILEQTHTDQAIL